MSFSYVSSLQIDSIDTEILNHHHQDRNQVHA